MIVEEQGIGFRTGVQLPSAPLMNGNPDLAASPDFLHL